MIDWETVCIVCLQKGENRFIFDEDNDSNVIADKIMKCSDILIKRDTNQPRSICLTCLDDLNVAYKFRRNCEQSDSIIKALLSTNHQEFDIKNLWKTTTNPVNQTLDIYIKDEVLDNFVAYDCENTSCFELEDNADACVRNNAMGINDVKSNQSSKLRKEVDCKVSSSPRRRPKKLSEESCDVSSLIVDDAVVGDICKTSTCPDLKGDSDAKSRFVENRADACVINNAMELNNMEASESDKTKQAVNYEISKPCRGRPRKLAKESSAKANLKSGSKSKPQKICRICGRTFMFKNKLDIHMRRHNNERPFGCNDCEKAFVTAKELRCHMRVHTGHRPLKCQYCDRRFSNYSVRKNHESTHTGERPFVCPTCGKSFGYSKGLTRHLRIHTGVKRFECIECGKGFTKKMHFEKHKTRHLIRNALNALGKSSEHKQIKWQDKEIFQIEENTNSNEINIKHEIVEDVVVEENASCFDLDIGSFTDTKNVEMIQHLNGENPKRRRGRPKKTGACPKVCEICHRDFKDQTSFDAHMRRHNNERPFSCDHCDKAFVTRTELVCHMRVHTGQKPLKCQYCDQRFSDYGVRKNHESTHTGERPYVCPTCGKSFGYSKGLTRHLQIHTGVKKFMCKQCGKGFTRKVLFEKHMAHHLGGDEVVKLSDDKPKKRRKQTVFQIGENATSNVTNIKQEVELTKEDPN